MATDPAPTSASAAFPAPPPSYKSFTPENLALLEASASSAISSPSFTQQSSTLSPALQHLTPPPPPSSGTYRCFGVAHTIAPPTTTSHSPPPTQARLRALTRSILLTFLSLTHTLASSPEHYGPHWDKLRDLFLEAHAVVNEYRPHQARETLIEMMEEQIRRGKEETKGAKDMVRRVREALEKVAASDDGDERAVEMNGRGEDNEQAEDENDEEKMVWTVLEREVGFA